MRRSMWPVALVALLIIDALLVAWALRPSTESSDAAPTASTSSTPAPTATSSKSVAAQSDRAIIVASNVTSAWRVLSGTTCSGAAAQLTTDSGKTWTAAPPLPLKAVFSASGNESGNAVLSGLDASCKPAVVELSRQSAQVTTAVVQWSVDPSSPDKLLHNGQPTAQACDSGQVRDLAADTALRANVLCEGGVVRRTMDGGATWKTVGTVKEATGIASGSAASGYKVYVASKRDCGVRVAPLADELAGTASGCLDGTAGATAADITMWGPVIWVGDAAKGWVTRIDSAGGTTSSSSSMAPTSTTASSTSSTSQDMPTPTSESTTAPAWTPATSTSTRTRTPRPWTPPAAQTSTQPTGTAEPTSSTDPGVPPTADPSTAPAAETAAQ